MFLTAKVLNGNILVCNDNLPSQQPFLSRQGFVNPDYGNQLENSLFAAREFSRYGKKGLADSGTHFPGKESRW